MGRRAGVGPDEDNLDDDVASVRKGLTEIGHQPFDRPFTDFEVPTPRSRSSR